MKRAPLHRRGPRTREWDKERRRLKVEFEHKGRPTTCEARYEGCWIDNALSWAHPRKRRSLLPGELGVAALLCTPCHEKAERLPAAEMYEVIMNLIAARDM